MKFQPDYRHFEDVMHNRKPARLPVYEHIVSAKVLGAITGSNFDHLLDGNPADQREFFRHFSGFFLDMTYDVVPFEVCISTILPGHGALMGGHPGPIQCRKDFDVYPWGELPSLFWKKATPRFDALASQLPQGMKAVGGIGNGLFELAEDLVGLEYLPFIQVDDPPLYGEIFVKIGDLMYGLWDDFLTRYGDLFICARFGDDLGFKSSLLTNPQTVRDHIMPQYRRIIGLAHSRGKRFLWHSCGNTFEVMDDAIAAGIDVKHSNEDAIAPFTTWIERYGDRIGLAGGFDLDVLIQNSPADVRRIVARDGAKYRQLCRGYALGSGNSIPDYMPPENYVAMLEGARDIRALEV